MAEPKVDTVTFTAGLHKSMSSTKDKGTLTGTGISEGDTVKVFGHHGQKSYVWTGKVGKQNADKSWPFEVSLKHAKQRDDKKDRDQEDVSTTVTNSSHEESQPVNNPMVPLVP